MFYLLRTFFCQGVVLAALVVGATNPAEARKYALLVGVSNYPNLEKRFQLNGPDNDVRLMRMVLRRLQVEEQDISVLYSSNRRKPTRANIIAGLREIAAKTTSKDFVYLYFAGHGSRQPARVGDLSEEDRLDEIFLPEDVGNWKDEIGAVERAITDNEIHELITRIRANGTFVWAVFDSCHSGTMLRSIGRIKWRKVDPNALGIPSLDSLNRKPVQSLPFAGGGGEAGSPVIHPGSARNSLTKPGDPGGYVAFYAAQSHELAPELKMPPNDNSSVSHGLFTYQLAQAMMLGDGMTYRQLGQTILQNYVKQGMRATTPLFEGSHLDAKMFGRVNQAAQRQWPVRFRNSQKSLFIPAGKLQQIGEGAVFALLANVSDRDEKAIAYARAGHVELFGAQLLPVAYGGTPLVDPVNLPRSVYARLVMPSFQFALRVAKPHLSDVSTDRERRVLRIIEKMAARRANEGRVTGKTAKGLRIDWQEAGTSADVHLVFSPRYGREPAQNGCVRNRLWFVDRTGALICSGGKANLAFRLKKPSVDFDANVERELGHWLNAIGKVRNLEQMVGHFKGGRFSRKIKVRLMVKKAAGGAETVVDQASRLPLIEGDRLRLEISNKTRSPVDLTVLFVDSHYGITPVFPLRGQTNRIAAKSQLSRVVGAVTPDTLGLEGMIIIASKAVPGTPAADFKFLAQKKLKFRKDVRAMGRAKAKIDPRQEAIEDLLAHAIFGRAALGKARKGATRSAGGQKKQVRTPFKNVSIQSLRWIVVD